MARTASKRNECGATLLEFAIAASVFLTSLFAVVECGRFLWTHNALRDATRRGARYAIVRKNDAASIQAVKNMVVYGDPNVSSGTPIINNLTPANVVVEYQNYNGIQLGSRATVSVLNYQFNFAVPLIGGGVMMPAYRTSLPGESAGFVPCDTPSATPMAPCNIVPN
jgi:Flp pilus assembly protein TadG